MTKKCPTCGGDGIVVSEHSAAVDVERKLRDLLRSRSQAVKVQLNARVASILVGPGAERLRELEAQTKRRIFIEAKEDVHTDHFLVLGHGPLSQLAPKAPVEDGQEVTVQLGEIGRHDAAAGVGKVDGLNVVVADAAKLVGKKVKVRIERVLDGTAYATLTNAPAKPPEPITAESEAEKPTRAPRRKAMAAPAAGPAVEVEAETPEEEAVAEEEPSDVEAVAEPETDGATPPKKRTRRGSRGGRGRKKKPAAAKAEAGAVESAQDGAAPEAQQTAPAAPRIHVPDDRLGRDGEPGSEPEAESAPAVAEAEQTGDGAQPAPKKRTRRGSRGGRGRKKKPAGATTAETNGGGDEPAPSESGESADDDSEWGYVPMSEWESDITPDSRSR